MNKVFLIGRLTADPVLRYTLSNVAVASFSLAVASNRKNEDGERETDFINIVVWRKQAENVKNYLFKGSKVAIDGHIQTRGYDDQNGGRKHVTEVVAENVEFLDNKKSDLAEKSPINDKHSDEPFRQFANEHQEDFKFKDEEGYDLPF